MLVRAARAIVGPVAAALLAAALLTGVTPTGAEPAPPRATERAGGHWVLGYYPGYQQDLLAPEDVPWASLTHLAVGAVLPRADATLDTSFYVDPVGGPALARVLADGAHDHGVVPLLMVGGAGAHDGFASAAENHRAALVTNLLAAMDDLGYDGLDLDWEPVEAGDEPALTALAHALRVARPGIVLSLPAGWVTTTFPDVPAFYGDLAADLDQLNVMTYGMADAWPGWQSWHSSALHGAGGATPSAVDVTVQAYLDAGVPAAKLGVGIGAYGSCWDGGVTGPRQATGGGSVVAGDNVMGATTIAHAYFDAAAYRYDPVAEAPYLSFASPHGPAGCTFVSYEDETSVAAKGAWARAQGLGGAIVWSINQGHDPTRPAGDRDPLLAAAHAAFVGEVPPDGAARPDALARVRPAGAWRGDGVFTVDGARQGRRAVVAAGGTARFVVRAQNDGTAPDVLAVSAVASTPAWRVRYLAGGEDVTRLVRTGAYRTVELAPGAEVRLTVEVTARAGVPGSSSTRLVVVRSTASPGLVDAVRLHVTRR